MEVRINAVEGRPAPPEGTFVSMRIGDVQKQSRFIESRTYKFPDQAKEKQHFGRLEVFKRIGYMSVRLDGKGREQAISIPCDFPGLSTLGLSLMARSRDA